MVTNGYLGYNRNDNDIRLQFSSLNTKSQLLLMSHNYKRKNNTNVKDVNTYTFTCCRFHVPSRLTTIAYKLLLSLYKRMLVLNKCTKQIVRYMLLPHSKIYILLGRAFWNEILRVNIQFILPNSPNIQFIESNHCCFINHK